MFLPTHNRHWLVLLVCAVFLLPLAAFASHPTPQPETENLQTRRDAVTTEGYVPLSLSVGAARFTFSALLEAEATLTRAEGGDAADDLRLSTLQLGLEAELTPWLGGHLIGLWEEDDTEPMVVDEAVLTLTSPWRLGAQTPALNLGRQYLPFGAFPSAMISDPLTLELGETQTSAALLDLSGESWSATLGAFEGSVDDFDDGIDSWVAALTVTPSADLTLDVSWISDLAESGAALVENEASYRDPVAGWSAAATFHHGPFTATAEYLAAMDRFTKAQAAAGNDLSGRRPRAWTVEFSWQVAERLQLAGRYETARDYQDGARRYGATLSYGLCDFALLAIEYLHSDGRGPGNDPVHTGTAQLAVQF